MCSVCMEDGGHGTCFGGPLHGFVEPEDVVDSQAALRQDPPQEAESDAEPAGPPGAPEDEVDARESDAVPAGPPADPEDEVDAQGSDPEDSSPPPTVFTESDTEGPVPPPTERQRLFRGGLDEFSRTSKTLRDLEFLI